MKNKMLQTLCIWVVLIVSATLQTVTANTFTFDNFSDYQYIEDTGGDGLETINSVDLLNGTDLINASRTFIGLATITTRRANVEIETNASTGVVQIGNDPASAGQASILWNFDPIDFTRFGTGFLLEVSDIDLSVNAEVIVNGVASSGSKTFSEIGGFLLKFSDFNNNADFSNVSSLRLNLSGPLAWDGGFRLSMDATPLPILTTVTSVPLPSAYFFMGSALLGFVGITRKKSA